MHIGLPKEIKDGEYRVALTPAGVGALARAGHAVSVQPGAGAGSGFGDADYERAGARLADPWSGELVVKVKELQPAERRNPRREQTIFCFQHFAPDAQLSRPRSPPAPRSSPSRRWARRTAACPS